MAKAVQYLVNTPGGQWRTIVAYSLKGAAREFCIKYHPMVGDQFMVKVRGGNDHAYFTRTKTGIRTLT